MKKWWFPILSTIVIIQAAGLIALYAQANSTWEDIHIGIPQTIEETNTSGENTPQPNTMQGAKLLISEVLVDGSKEFVKISNIGETAYQGEVKLSNSNKSQKIILNLSPQAHLIISRTDPENKLNFWFTDTAELNLILSDSSGELDIFYLSSEDVKAQDGKGLAFIKKEEGWIFTIIPSEQTEVDTDENPNQGTPLKIPESQWQLLLTEAFFSKENNWLEITNTSENNYEWKISINWFEGWKKIETDIQISAKSNIILAKNEKYLAIENFSYQIINIPNIDRTQSLLLTLTHTEGRDNIWVDKARLDKIKNSDSSIEKVRYQDKIITTRNLERRDNIRGKIIANPGYFHNITDKPKDISLPLEKKEEINTDNQDQLCQNFTDRYTVEIKEIFGWNQIYPAFIELEINENPQKYTDIKLSGTPLQEELTITLNEDRDLREKGKTLLISHNETREAKGIDNLIATNFWRTQQTGTLILEGFDGQSRQVLDIVVVNQEMGEESLYPNWEKAWWCMKNFSEKWAFSPGFDKKFLEFFAIDSKPKIEYIYITKPSWSASMYSCPTKADLCPADPINKTEKNTQPKEKNTTTEENIENKPLLESDNYQIKIEDIVYDPPGADHSQESITLVLTKWGELDLKNINLNIDGKNKKISWKLSEGISQTFYGNFWFPNSKKDHANVVVQIKMGNQIFDTFIYTPKTNLPQEKNKKQSLDWIKVFSVLDGDTIRYKDKDGKLQSVRLLGVDAPESNTARYKKTECYGKESKAYLTQVLKGKTIELEFDQNQAQNDSYWRQIAYVYLEGRLINQELIEQWYAKEYTHKTEYHQQRNFQEKEQQAKRQHRGMRNPNICPGNSEEQEESIQNTIKNLVIKITDIIYNPKGSDTNNEQIKLSLFSKDKQLTKIDFTQQWGIFIFEHSGDYKSINIEDLESGLGKFIDLSFVWTQDIKENLILSWNFSLPNNKPSCIALIQKDYLYDIACYTLWEAEREKKSESELWSGSKIRILSLLPNPKGKDQDKEFIELISDEAENIELWSWFHLLINGKNKKRISWQLMPGSANKIYGNFSFPNDHGCVSIMQEKILIDSFCYEKREEWTIFAKNNTILEAIAPEELTLLKNIKFIQKWNQRCISYENTLLKCRNIPRSKTDSFLKTESRMYRQAFKVLEKIIKDKYTPLYYQTEIKEFFDLLKEGKDDLSKKIITTNIHWINFLRADFDKIYEESQKNQILHWIIKLFTSIIQT